MRYTCSCRPAGASPTQVCMLSVAARVSPECHLKALSRVTWWLTRPSVRSRVVTGGDQIWVTTLVPLSDQWELATDHRDLSGSDTFSLDHHLWRHCPVLTLCSRRGTQSSTGRQRRRTALLSTMWPLCRAVLCSDFAIIFAALLQNIISCFTSVFSTVAWLEIELAVISARPRPLPGHEKPAVLHWCRPTRIWIWTSGGSGLDLTFSPGSGGSGSQPTSTGSQPTSVLPSRSESTSTPLSGSQPTSTRYPDLSRLLCYLAAIQLFLHRLHDCHLCNCDPCLCTTGTDSSTFSKPAQHIQQTGICQTGTPLPSTRGHLTDIACMPVQLDAAAVYGASPLSPVLSSPSPRQPLTAAARHRASRD